MYIACSCTHSLTYIVIAAGYLSVKERKKELQRSVTKRKEKKGSMEKKKTSVTETIRKEEEQGNDTLLESMYRHKKGTTSYYWVKNS